MNPSSEFEAVSEKKSELRRLIKSRWERISPEYRQELNQRAVNAVSANKEFKQAKTVIMYASDRYELDITALMSPGRVYAFPCVMPECRLIFREVKDISELIPHTYGIYAPLETAREINPDEADFMIVPALAADTTGIRQGRGGGYYDRLLPSLSGRIQTLCVLPCFSFFHRLPALPHDVSVMHVLTVS